MSIKRLGLRAVQISALAVAAGLIALSGSRRLSLAIVFVTFHLAIDLLVGDSLALALLYTIVDMLEVLAIWAVCQRLWRGAPRIRTMRSLALRNGDHVDANRELAALGLL